MNGWARWWIALVLVACGAPSAAPKPPPAPADSELYVPPMPSGRAAATTSPPAALPLANADPAAKRAKQLFDHADWLGTELTVEIYEPLYDSAHSSAADDGAYDVEVADVGPKRLEISAATSAAETAAGGLAELPTDLRPPVRVRGVLARSRIGLRLVAREIEQLAFPTASRLPNAKALVDDPAKWSGKYVELEDTWLVGFEASYLGQSRVWLEMYPSVTIRCAPATPAARNGPVEATWRRVRVLGYAYTSGGSYGHLGASVATVVATELVYIDPKRPECR